MLVRVLVRGAGTRFWCGVLVRYGVVAGPVRLPLRHLPRCAGRAGPPAPVRTSGHRYDR
ncbi:hypothetical protein SLNWT_3120 [Streptomyces albus]|uniref:Uncharacterized protein n=1 Tax=Streptomyces albus (strain ATCC 21838 / DSM 41398 / FERM P-419 / JCM 4703 / NBRC 107858) TaxID=1081613 RepID=A0A0B5EXY1_STRA4|nr:hypothetical protein SLNWT_3120 [Streptomyces albus]AOU77804.1 hypothetical protein SLNHY_3113 [Streptomyces albus]